MKVRFLKDDSYKLSEQEDALIIETDEFILADNAGSTYDFDGRDSFLKKHNCNIMEKSKIFFFLCAALVLVSCSDSNDDPVLNNTSAVYKVVLEASGDDYTAEAIIINPDNVSIIDETSNTDLKQSSVTEYFSGRKVYTTSKEVKVISAQGIILSKSKSGATLKMTVYQNGKEVYQNTVSVPDSEKENNTKSIQYTNIKN